MIWLVEGLITRQGRHLSGEGCRDASEDQCQAGRNFGLAVAAQAVWYLASHCIWALMMRNHEMGKNAAGSGQDTSGRDQDMAYAEAAR
jgi:hypothetical protein